MTSPPSKRSGILKKWLTFSSGPPCAKRQSCVLHWLYFYACKLKEFLDNNNSNMVFVTNGEINAKV
jgi:hypothetical protein